MKKIRFTLTALLLCGTLALGSCSAEKETSTTTGTTTTEATTETTTTEATTETTTTEATTETTTTEATTETTATEATTETTTTEATTETTTTEATAETTTAETTTEATTTEKTTETTAEQPAEKKYIALTFDDGPNTTTTMQVLDALEKYDIVASFFLVGNNINDESAKAVKRAFDMGCEINNHSKTHSNMATMSAEDIKAELEFTDSKILEITGVAPKFFRPPYISVSTDMFDAIDLPFIAGAGCNDWEDKVTAEMRSKRTIRQAKDGTIILMHDAEGNSQTVEALDTIIPELLSQGFEFVTVSQLFELEGIETSPESSIIYSNVFQTTMY